MTRLASKKVPKQNITRLYVLTSHILAQGARGRCVGGRQNMEINEILWC